MDKLRILLVDDHVVLREGLAALLNAQNDMVVVAQASDGLEALKQVQQYEPDVVVMDLSMPGVNGVRATDAIRRSDSTVQIVVLTRHQEPGYVRQMLEAGARGYVLKQAGAQELLAAIRSVMSDTIYLDATLTERLTQQFVKRHEQRSENEVPELSEREADVVRFIAHGYSNKEVAAQLGLSVKTVDTYKTRAMEKLGLYGRAALVRYALQRGWLDVS